MVTWQRLVEKADRELAMLDIAEVNLLCGEGLPGLDEPELRWAIGTIDHWASSARAFTEQVMPMFYSGESDYPDSEPRFRIQAMITHLQRDLGIRYRHDLRQDDAVFEPADSFLHGILQGKGGTCASLPVLYAAIGRRLGYPLMLAETKGHLYARWDAEPGGECFNIEASGDGVSFFADDYFRTERYEMPADTIEACGYLKSLSPREEVVSFLLQRGECWLQDKAYAEAALSFAFGNEAAPHRPLNAFML